jgi:hypothetical protein
MSEQARTTKTRLTQRMPKITFRQLCPDHKIPRSEITGGQFHRTPATPSAPLHGPRSGHVD